MYGRELISRRRLLQRGAALAAPFAALQAREQDGSAAKPGAAFGEVPVRLVKAISSAGLLDVSPDSTKLCLYFTRRPFLSFREVGSAWRGSNEPVRDGDDALRVINRDSWASTYATRLPSLPFFGSFFADSEAICVEMPAVHEREQRGNEHVVVSLRTGEKTAHFSPFDAAGTLFVYSALDDRTLLGTGFNRATNKTDVLTKVEASSFKEIERVPFAGTPSPSLYQRETFLMVSADRKTFVYTVDHNVVCRRTDDLGIKWSRETDPILGLSRVAVSAGGGLVAASLRSLPNIPATRPPRIEVYDGKNGTPIATIPADAGDTIAISPDGKLLAAGHEVAMQGRRSGTQPTVLLFEIATGKKLATLIHDQFRDGGAESLYARFGVNGVIFTPDNKYLITSGLNTKVWEIGRG